MVKIRTVAFFTPLILNCPKEHVWNSWKVRKFLTVSVPCKMLQALKRCCHLVEQEKLCSLTGEKKKKPPSFPPCSFCQIRKSSPVPWEERGRWAEDVLGRSWSRSAHTSTAHSQKEVYCLWFSSFYFPSSAPIFFFFLSQGLILCPLSCKQNL